MRTTDNRIIDVLTYITGGCFATSTTDGDGLIANPVHRQRMKPASGITTQVDFKLYRLRQS